MSTTAARTLSQSAPEQQQWCHQCAEQIRNGTITQQRSIPIDAVALFCSKKCDDGFIAAAIGKDSVLSHETKHRLADAAPHVAKGIDIGCQLASCKRNKDNNTTAATIEENIASIRPLIPNLKRAFGMAGTWVPDKERIIADLILRIDYLGDSIASEPEPDTLRLMRTAVRNGFKAKLAAFGYELNKPMDVLLDTLWRNALAAKERSRDWWPNNTSAVRRTARVAHDDDRLSLELATLVRRSVETSKKPNEALLAMDMAGIVNGVVDARGARGYEFLKRLLLPYDYATTIAGRGNVAVASAMQPAVAQKVK